jgi:hypothetical protein
MRDYYSSDDEYAGSDGIFHDFDMPEDWRFLFDWFEGLANRLLIADRARLDTSAADLGRDPATDWWIDVDHEVGFLVSDYDERDGEDCHMRYRRVRESLILQCIMAHVDYDDWIDELRRSTRFLPTKWVNLNQEELPRKFSFRLQDISRTRGDLSLFGWEMLEDLLGTKNFSTEFQSDFTRACAIANARGVDVSTMEAIPIRVHFAPLDAYPRIQQVQVLKKLRNTVTQLREIEESHRAKTLCRDRESPPVPPVFRLECVALDCRHFMFHSTVLKEIQAIVETGVYIESLMLPGRYAPRTQEPAGALRVTWAAFVCAVTGHPTKTVLPCARAARVGRLVLSGLPPVDAWAIPLLSALATSTTVHTVRIDHVSLDEGLWHLWAWMGYAFFRTGSPTSVKTLELSGCKLTQAAVDALAKVTVASDPLMALWRLSSANSVTGAASEAPPDVESTAGPLPVTVPRGTPVTTIGSTIYDPPTVTLPCDWTGTMLNDGGMTASNVVLLLPGFGLCHVDRDAMPRKRSRTTNDRETSADEVVEKDTILLSPIRTLVLGLRPNPTAPASDVAESKALVPQILQLVGQPLTALSLFANDVDNACLEASLVSCPKLRCLRLRGLALTSMEPLVNAYKDHKLRISSLELRDLPLLPGPALEAFLAHLEPNHAPNPIRASLRKLRIGKGWGTDFRIETVQMMTRILETPESKLVYIHTHNHYDGDESMRRAWQLRDFRGTTHEDAAALEAASRRAFLSVVHSGDHSATMRMPRTLLSQDTITKIFAFAATPTSRVVIDDDDMGDGFFRSDNDEF